MDIRKIEIDAALASAQWNYAKAEAARDDAADRVAGLGRWWLNRAGGHIVLSPVAASFLGVERQPVFGSRLVQGHLLGRPMPMAALADATFTSAHRFI
jgi:hypothetical protein